MDKIQSFRDQTAAPLRDFAQQHPILVSLTLVVLFFIVSARAVRSPSTDDDPPMMRDIIPHISNTYQFIMKMDKFLTRAV